MHKSELIRRLGAAIEKWDDANAIATAVQPGTIEAQLRVLQRLTAQLGVSDAAQHVSSLLAGESAMRLATFVTRLRRGEGAAARQGGHIRWLAI